MMLFVYSGNGNSIPSVDTVSGSLPVDGFSPGSGCALGVVRGAASRLVLSAVGGGGAGATVLFGDFALGAGAGFSSAGRSTASGALRASSVGAGAATRWTRYVGGAGLRALAAPPGNSTPTKAWTSTVPARPMPTLAGARGRRFTAPRSPARPPGPRRSRRMPESPPAPAPHRRRGPDRRPGGTPQWAVWFARRRGRWRGTRRRRVPPAPCRRARRGPGSPPILTWVRGGALGRAAGGRPRRPA